jgi:hypothetical protein
MKAIVLSFDDQLEIANFVVESYHRLWPDCPFTFRIPYAKREPASVFKARNIEPISTPRDIRSSMQNLLGGLPDNEFVYWCIDDRYPIAIYDVETIVAVQQYVEDSACALDAIRITGPFRPDRSDRAFVPGDDRIINGVRFRRQSGRNFGFYMPQFVRAGVLRRHFFHPSLPVQYSIREFHTWLLNIPIGDRIYMPERFLIKVGEATIKGEITEACACQMTSLGLDLPKIAGTIANKSYG